LRERKEYVESRKLPTPNFYTLKTYLAINVIKTSNGKKNNSLQCTVIATAHSPSIADIESVS